MLKPRLTIKISERIDYLKHLRPFVLHGPPSGGKQRAIIGEAVAGQPEAC